jgi:hypothetical protein
VPIQLNIITQKKKEKVHTRFRWGDLWEIDHLENLSLGGRIILKWVFKKWDEGTWTGLIWFRVGQVTGSCEGGYEYSVFIKRGDFLGYLRTC